jgi:Calcium-dependent channel, 7TM region, putative phosphate
MHTLARLMRGGGPGGPIPFRIYVDSGVVFLCVVALAPASPLVAPAAFFYFLLFAPMIRWLVIFVYRPDHDAGGRRWPFVFGIFISSMISGQVRTYRTL